MIKCQIQNSSHFSRTYAFYRVVGNLLTPVLFLFFLPGKLFTSHWRVMLLFTQASA